MEKFSQRLIKLVTLQYTKDKWSKVKTKQKETSKNKDKTKICSNFSHIQAYNHIYENVQDHLTEQTFSICLA